VHQIRKDSAFRGRSVGRRSHDAVVGAVEDDGRHRNRRTLGQPGLGIFEARLARSIADAVPVGVDHDVDEVGVVERRRRAVEGVVGETPRWRYLPPEMAADVTPVRLQPARPCSVLKYHWYQRR
jgi:hypothetical protein